MNNNLNKEVQFIDLGLIDYQEGWNMQEKLFAEVVGRKVANREIVPKQQKTTPNYLLFCQHPHVYTLGKSGKINNLLLSESGLEEKEAKFYKINRGGDITYHGPGQLVVYPILDLENFFTDIHRYLRFLEEAVILTLASFGIKSVRVDGLTGVWIDSTEQDETFAQRSPRKICAMGVKSSRWVTMHGLALNVNTDLNYFQNIIPCGINDKAVTSMATELGKTVDIEEVATKLRENLSNIFEMKCI
jgi:lipoyl(octanoyl) transferase